MEAAALSTGMRGSETKAKNHLTLYPSPEIQPSFYKGYIKSLPVLFLFIFIKSAF